MGSQYKHLYTSTPILITMKQINIQIITLYWRRPNNKGIKACDYKVLSGGSNIPIRRYFISELPEGSRFEN